MSCPGVFHSEKVPGSARIRVLVCALDRETDRRQIGQRLASLAHLTAGLKSRCGGFGVARSAGGAVTRDAAREVLRRFCRGRSILSRRATRFATRCQLQPTRRRPSRHHHRRQEMSRFCPTAPSTVPPPFRAAVHDEILPPPPPRAPPAALATRHAGHAPRPGVWWGILRCFASRSGPPDPHRKTTCCFPRRHARPAPLLLLRLRPLRRRSPARAARAS